MVTLAGAAALAAAVGGVEYTFCQVRGSAADGGLVARYF